MRRLFVWSRLYKLKIISVGFFEIIEKARNKPEHIKYVLAVFLTCIIMAVIVSVWLVASLALSRNEPSPLGADNYSRDLGAIVKDFLNFSATGGK